MNPPGRSWAFSRITALRRRLRPECPLDQPEQGRHVLGRRRGTEAYEKEDTRRGEQPPGAGINAPVHHQPL